VARRRCRGCRDARLTGLTAYDASYLWLAGWLEADLVTLDRRLAAVVELDSE
jgi:predicted nucleic acid-binding protein